MMMTSRTLAAILLADDPYTASRIRQLLLAPESQHAPHSATFVARPARAVTILNTPGTRENVHSVLSAIMFTDVVILAISVREEKIAEAATNRRAYSIWHQLMLLRACNVHHMIILFHDMDEVAWSEDMYSRAISAMSREMAKIGFGQALVSGATHAGSIYYVGGSARTGRNINHVVSQNNESLDLSGDPQLIDVAGSQHKSLTKPTSVNDLLGTIDIGAPVSAMSCTDDPVAIIMQVEQGAGSKGIAFCKVLRGYLRPGHSLNAGGIPMDIKDVGYMASALGSLYTLNAGEIGMVTYVSEQKHPNVQDLICSRDIYASASTADHNVVNQVSVPMYLINAVNHRCAARAADDRNTTHLMLPYECILHAPIGNIRCTIIAAMALSESNPDADAITKYRPQAGTIFRAIIELGRKVPSAIFRASNRFFLSRFSCIVGILIVD